MTGIHMRRFFHLQKPEASLSSRFGGIPALMEREPTPAPLSVRYTPSSPMNPYLVLPPISYRKFGSNQSENSVNFVKPTTHSKSYSNSMSHHSILDDLIRSLKDMCDPDLLPDHPIVLREDQEAAIMLETNYQLGGADYDPGSLKALYITLTSLDMELTGCISYEDLVLAFQRKMVPITEQLLRLIAAQFVSRQQCDKVNYEKILSFIGAAMKINTANRTNSRGHAAVDLDSQSRSYPSPHSPRRAHTNKSVYYHDNRCPNNEEQHDVFTEKDDPVLLRLLENSIRHQFTPFNLESLRISFQRADRLHRGVLSEQQIKDLCFQHDIRIEDTLLERIIHRCKQRGGGQYDWMQFIRYLERVQPVQTSLNITSSRSPAEYQMIVPHPSSSWPQAETPAAWGTPLHTHHSPIPPPIYKSGGTDLPPPLSSKSNHEVQTLYVQNDEDDDYIEQYNRPLQHKLNQLQHEVDNLTNRNNSVNPLQVQMNETNKENRIKEHDSIILPVTSSEDMIARPWFDRFMEMADLIYKYDKNATGALPQSELIKMMESYNNHYKLRLQSNDIQNAIIASKKSSGSIDINSFLKFLATKSQY